MGLVRSCFVVVWYQSLDALVLCLFPWEDLPPRPKSAAAFHCSGLPSENHKTNASRDWYQTTTKQLLTSPISDTHKGWLQQVHKPARTNPTQWGQPLLPCGCSQSPQLVSPSINPIHLPTNNNKSLATKEDHTQHTRRSRPEHPA